MTLERYRSLITWYGLPHSTEEANPNDFYGLCEVNHNAIAGYGIVLVLTIVLQHRSKQQTLDSSVQFVRGG